MRDIDGGTRLLVPGRGATLGRVVFLSGPEVVEEVLAAEPELDTWGLMTRLRQRRWEERGRKGRPPGPWTNLALIEGRSSARRASGASLVYRSAPAHETGNVVA